MIRYQTYKAIGNVTVLDRNGLIYYTFGSDKPFYFNLNINDFTYFGSITPYNKKMVYKCNVIGKSVHLPEFISISFANMENKAQMNRATGEIVINSKYLYEPFFKVAFLYFHEFAHFKYPSKNGIRSTINEYKCDKFAACMMLKNGFNPSQILAAMMFTLNNGDEQNERYGRIERFLKRIERKFVSYE